MADTAFTDDDGFGLVEAVVSMLVLATLAIAFLPLLITGLTASAENATTAFATQLVGERMSLAQTMASSADSCAAIDLAVAPATDPRGVEVAIETTVVEQQPGLCHVTSTALVAGEPLATSSTLVYLP